MIRQNMPDEDHLVADHANNIMPQAHVDVRLGQVVSMRVPERDDLRPRVQILE